MAAKAGLRRKQFNLIHEFFEERNVRLPRDQCRVENQRKAAEASHKKSEWSDYEDWGYNLKPGRMDIFGTVLDLLHAQIPSELLSSCWGATGYRWRVASLDRFEEFQLTESPAMQPSFRWKYAQNKWPYFHLRFTPYALPYSLLLNHRKSGTSPDIAWGVNAALYDSFCLRLMHGRSKSRPYVVCRSIDFGVLLGPFDISKVINAV
ncbi:uncharacterized protein BO96DRAFT_351322 [Aspergillus niger CBS 101883]|uniref:uncharacterized protein n=1 Tax=Aspergillus lacticoffeatus (strain CBS 101883) TaxID=1450533 RepID=UPI000D7F7426|nr:uncharacterized protein BO96DRAFT_351322 [Aspergillus niger CBS 101883]PYH50915.1 hypothetical protein BO96DRAFT_351322 [Aspergillus niger CBS 101883]